jgi:hypothetical protein
VSDHDRRRKQVREANRRMRARRMRGQYRRMLTIPGAQFRRLAELGYLKRVADPIASSRGLGGVSLRRVTGGAVTRRVDRHPDRAARTRRVGPAALERKKILKGLLPRDPLLHYSKHIAEFGTREFAKAQRAHEEGVISKLAAGLYYSGKRTREWLTARRQEAFRPKSEGRERDHLAYSQAGR